MTEQDRCARCGRPRWSALNDQMERCRAAETQPCLRHELQPPPRPPEVVTNSDLDQELAKMRQQLDSARTEAAQVKQQVEAITLELRSAREQVTQHQADAEQAHGARESAQALVGRLNADLAKFKSKTAPPDAPEPPGPNHKLIQRVLAWLATSRMALASGGSALGIALGAFGVAGWHYTNPTPAPEPAPVSASALPSRIQDALPQDLHGMELHVDTVTKKVKVDKALVPMDRERAMSTIKGVYSGAGLPPPTIDFPPDLVVPETVRPLGVSAIQSRVTDALQRQGLGKVKARVEESSGPGGAKVMSVDIEANGIAQTTRANSIIQSAFAGAGLPDPVLQHPVIAARPPTPIPAPASSSPALGPRTEASAPMAMAAASRAAGGRPRLEDECYREQNPLQQILNWKLTGCMQKKCCGLPMNHNQECISFDRKYPLNCP